MIAKPEVIEVALQTTAVVRLTVPRSEIQQVMGPGITELMTTCATQGVVQTGPWFTHHFRMEPTFFDFEIGVPVATPVTPAGRVLQGELPAAKVARAVYTGPYEGLGSAWAELGAWIQEQGLSPQAALWEVYAVGPESGPDSSQWQTVLHRPLDLGV